MRLWSIHPKYLDRYGLVALWREALLAQKALAGGAAGYQNNPQLIRFKNKENPHKAIGSYLSFVASEGARQGFKLNHEKIIYPNFDEEVIKVEPSQLAFEVEHLKNKLRQRDKAKFKALSQVKKVETNPIFNIQ